MTNEHGYYDKCRHRIKLTFVSVETREFDMLHNSLWQGTYGSCLFYTIRKATLLEVDNNTTPVATRLIRKVFK